MSSLGGKRKYIFYAVVLLFAFVLGAKAQNTTTSYITIENLDSGQVVDSDRRVYFTNHTTSEDVIVRIYSNSIQSMVEVAEADFYHTTNLNETRWYYDLEVGEFDNGSYQMHTSARFSGGTEIQGQSVNFEIHNPPPPAAQPVLIMADPDDQETIDGIYTFRAESDPPLSQANIIITDNSNNRLVTLNTNSSTDGNHRVDYDTNSLNNDAYIVYAEHYDSTNQITSEPVHFTIDNYIPPTGTTTTTSTTTPGSNPPPVDPPQNDPPPDDPVDDDTTEDDSTATNSDINYLISLVYPSDLQLTKDEAEVRVQVVPSVDNVYYRIGPELFKTNIFNNQWKGLVQTGEHREVSVVVLAYVEGEQVATDHFDMVIKSPTTEQQDTSIDDDIEVGDVDELDEQEGEDARVIGEENSVEDQENTHEEEVEVIEDKTFELENITDVQEIEDEEQIMDEPSISPPREKYDDCQEVTARMATCENIKKGIVSPHCAKKYINVTLCEEKLTLETRSTDFCNQKNIKNRARCRELYSITKLPKECQEKGLHTKDECDEYLRNNFINKICVFADDKNCAQTLTEKHKDRMQCEGDDCDYQEVTKALPKLATKLVQQGRTRDLLHDVDFGVIDMDEEKEVDELTEEIIQVLPIKKQTKKKVRLLKAEDKIQIEEEEVEAPLPAIVIYDSDEDGLPDSVEERLGTDPFKADTDNDGFTDKEEIDNGYDPLQDGSKKIGKVLKPVEKALVENKTFEHPIFSGVSTDELEIKNVENITEEEDYNKEKPLIFSGIARPFDIVALYIYSDLPLVLTIEADKNGNWEYSLEDPMVDGEHEVFVTINDDTGRVIEKSKPYTFFISEAQAISVDEFVEQTATEEEKSSVFQRYYIYGSILLVFLGLVVMRFLYLEMRKKEEEAI